MSTVTSRNVPGYERVVAYKDPASGLHAIIAIHDTTLGPALGGCRMFPYADEEQALQDVLRLSRGMTYKSAMAELPFGGGKSVIIGDPRKHKSEELLKAFGGFVDHLGGQYITAEDVGTCAADMELIRAQTQHVAGLPDQGGDPSPATARGVFHGIRAAVRHAFGQDSLEGLTVAVQGVGNVGGHLADTLSLAGARLIVTDINNSVAHEVAARTFAGVVAPDEIFNVEADVFAPCAMGAVLNDNTIPRLTAGIVAGSANNQLAEDRHAELLIKRGILYAPDYVLDAGGIINIYYEKPVYDHQAAFAHISGIYDNLIDLFRRADVEGLSPHLMADRMAEERIEAARIGEPLMQKIAAVG
jgi:leucine dehydrogenase